MASAPARTQTCVDPGAYVRFDGPVTSSVGGVLSIVTGALATAEARPLTSVARAVALVGPSGNWAESMAAANGAPVAATVVPPRARSTFATPKLSDASADTVTAPRTNPPPGAVSATLGGALSPKLAVTEYVAVPVLGVVTEHARLVPWQSPSQRVKP